MSRIRQEMDRREFLRRSALAGIGAGMAVLPLDAARAAEPPRVRRRLTLGRTGLQVPDIGFGSSRLAGDEAVVRHALERGISYFDTAEGYKGGEAEKTLGSALRGRRDQVVLVSKVQTGSRAKRGEFMTTSRQFCRQAGNSGPHYRC